MSLASTKAKHLSGELTKAQYIAEMHKLHAALYEYADFMRDTDIGRIELCDGEVIMTSRSTGVKMYCDRADHRIAPIEILNFGAYEKTDYAMLRSLLDDGGHLFDIGANFGWYSIGLSQAVPGLKVWAFEPLPKTFSALKRNLELNGSASVTALNYGLSEKAGESVFYFYPEGSGNASLANLSERGDAEKVVCRLRRLDEAAAELGARVDLIKCDVEGAELFVFKGGVETLKRDRPVVFTEMLRKWAARFNYHPNEIIDLLSGLGYRCFTADGATLKPFARMDDATAETNFFFLHGEKHAAKIKRLSA